VIVVALGFLCFAIWVFALPLLFSFVNIFAQERLRARLVCKQLVTGKDLAQRSGSWLKDRQKKKVRDCILNGWLLQNWKMLHREMESLNMAAMVDG
jgi:hypothetical protein